jgi:5-methylcytosine-specific restriction endonuclease McrA
MPFAPPKHRPPGWKPAAKKVTESFYNTFAWQQTRDRIKYRDGGICANCGKPDSWRVDHIRPRTQGGPDHDWNLRLLCDACDAIRHAEKGHVWR